MPPAQPEAVMVALAPKQILCVEGDKVGLLRMAIVIVTEALSLAQPLSVQADL